MKLLSLTLITLALTAFSACTKKENSMGSATQAQSSDSAATELKIEDTQVGNGAEAVAGKNITVHYTGTLTDGRVFDTSRSEGRTPFQFVLGQGSVIQGWDKGLVGMKVGGKRKLTIPAQMAYGPNAVGTIPANSTLLFDVELLKVE